MEGLGELFSALSFLTVLMIFIAIGVAYGVYLLRKTRTMEEAAFKAARERHALNDFRYKNTPKDLEKLEETIREQDTLICGLIEYVKDRDRKKDKKAVLPRDFDIHPLHTEDELNEIGKTLDAALDDCKEPQPMPKPEPKGNPAAKMALHDGVVLDQEKLEKKLHQNERYGLHGILEAVIDGWIRHSMADYDGMRNCLNLAKITIEGILEKYEEK
jgi:hypothetical protein